MNIMFTKKIIAFVVALIMIIGITMPSFAKFNKNNLFNKDDIEQVLRSSGLDRDVKEALEAVLEAMEKGIEIERGRRIYDEDENLIDINLKSRAVKVTKLVVTDEYMLLEIEYDSKNGYINISEDVYEEDAEKVEKAQAEAEQRAKEQAEKEAREREEAEQRAKEQAEKEAREKAEAEQRAKEQAEKEAREREEAEQRAKEQEKQDIEEVILNKDEEKDKEEQVPSILEKLKGVNGIFNKLLPIIQNIMRIIAKVLKNRLSQFFKALM